MSAAEIQTVQPDTVVLYDVMREGATHLVAVLLEQSVERGGELPHEVVLERVAQVRARVDVVPPRDPDAIAAAIEEFRLEREAAVGV